MPGKKKKYNARFPPARIKKIMQTDEDVGKVAAAVPVIISRSLELFIDSLIERTASITRAKNAKTLSTSHIKQAIHSEKTFDFLRDLVKAIPDHQVDEDGDGAVASGSGTQEKKPRPAKPRKPREEGARPRGRPRKVKPEPEVKKSSSSDEEDDEETETDEEGTSQEEAGPSDLASNSPAYNPAQVPDQQDFTPPQTMAQQAFTSPQVPPCDQGFTSNQAPRADQGFTPPQIIAQQAFTSPQVHPVNQGLTPPQTVASRLEPPQDPAATSPAISVPHNQRLSPHNPGVSNQQLVNPQFSPSVMAQMPFQPQQAFPIQNFQFPQYVIPPGNQAVISPGSHSVIPPGAPSVIPAGAQTLAPPPFLVPGSTVSPQHSPLPQHMGQGMMPYPHFMPPLSPFMGQAEGPGMGPNGTHNAQLLAPPGSTAGQTLSTPGQQCVGQQLASRPEPVNHHHDANMPLDMSIAGKSRHPSQSQSQGGASMERPPPLTSIPVPRGLPALVCQGYGAPPQDQATVASPAMHQGHHPHSQPVYQHSVPAHIDSQYKLNKAISQDTNTDSTKVYNSAVPEKKTKTAVHSEELARLKMLPQENKGLVSFPGLSNIMKVNSLKPVNNDDDDYDT